MIFQENMLKVISEELVPVSGIDIKSLAEIYDEEDIYLSIYLPVSGAENERLNKLFINSRVKAIKKALS